MTPRRAGAWAFVGFVVGGAIAGLNVRRAPGVDRAPAASDGDSDGRTPLPCTDPPELATRAATVDRMHKEAETLFIANLQGHFLPPEGLPARFSGPAIERALQTAIVAAGVKAEALGTDCSEYPCLATARVHSEEEMQKIKDQFFDHPGYAADMKQLARARGAGPTEYRFGATAYPATDPRQGEIVAALDRRLGAARMGPGSPRPERHPLPPDTIGASTTTKE